MVGTYYRNLQSVGKLVPRCHGPQEQQGLSCSLEARDWVVDKFGESRRRMQTTVYY